MSEPSANPVLPEWSAYAGEPFNLSERRPLAIRAESDEAFIVDGFYHQGEFWQAVIPKVGVAEIIGQRFNFSKPKRREDGTSRPSLFLANHVQARVRMRPDAPLRLYANAAEPRGPAAHTLADFCYSVEAVGPHRRRWNLSDALLGNLAVVHRFLSIEEVAFERIVRERMTVLQSPPLPLEAALLDAILHEAIRESHTTALTRPYFMYRLPFSATNCTSEPLKLLDGVLRTSRGRRALYRFPIHPRGYLKLRGLWQDGAPTPTLNEQMADWLAGEQAKERRQLHLAKKHERPRETAEPPRVPWRRHLGRFFKAVRT
jgi:hypothetical protein